MVAFEALLRRVESDTLDFKRSAYEFDGDNKKRQRAAFVKDIIAMFNSPREQDAYIVLGIDRPSGGAPTLFGVASHPDDAELQAKFEGLVHPHPVFRYEAVDYGGKQFGLLHIPIDRSRGPCVPVCDADGTLERHRVYIRRNSQNAIADAQEQRRVYRWFQDTPSIPADVPPISASWTALVDGLRHFDPAYNYVLIVPRIENAPQIRLENLGLVNWSLVIDFDPESDVTGILSTCRATLARRRALHLISRGQRVRMNPLLGAYWYFARGQMGRDSTLAIGKHRDWLRSYGDDLREQLLELARRGAARPFVVLALCYDNSLARHVASVFEAAAATFGEAASFVAACESDPSDFTGLHQDYDAVVVQIAPHQLCHGLASLQDVGQQTSDSALPSSSGAPVFLEPELHRQLAEDLEIVHLAAGSKPELDREPERDFLRGHEITWHDLGLRADVEREIAPKIVRIVRQDLSARTTSRVNLYHAPGAGGTTLAKRILWELHREFPSFVLRRCVPQETVERLAQIVSLSGNSLLVAAEGHLVTETELDQLYGIIRARHLPVVLLQVLRRGQVPDARTLRQRTFYVSEALSSTEAAAFAHYLKRISPHRSRELDRAVGSANGQERTPFYLGLVAFERDFVGIERYIEAKLASLNSVQAKLFTHLAIAYSYAQRPIPAHMFCGLLGLPGSSALDLRKALPESILDLLVEDSPRSWRPSHHLVAEASLRHLLTPKGGDPRVWKQSLSARAREFIDFCRYAAPSLDEEAFELLRRVFVLRDSREDLGTERASSLLFSQIIEDIPNDPGRLEVLRYLTDSVPDEPHFWAHLGRFLSYRSRDFDKALQAIDRGLQLAPADHLLHHMRGMALRGKAYELMDRRGPIEEIVAVAVEASESFSQAQELAPEDEYGYISEAQLIIRALDYAGATAESNRIEAICAHGSLPWLRESIQRVEDLLAQVRSNRVGDLPSDYEERCRADLSNVYGQHDKALQSFQNLLDRKQVYAPPIRRQIIWTYLARRGRDWGQLAEREISRIVNLLEENMQEEAGDPRNLRLWMRAIRRLSTPPTLERVLEQVGYWNANSNSLESSYYLYTLNTLRALEGLALARDQAERALAVCREKSSYLRNRTRSFEWLGGGTSIQQLVHQDGLGDWNPAINFYQNVEPLRRIEGVISRIDRPEKGEIELPGSVRAFFVPGQSGHFRGRDENQRVACFLGFSYDGPRAWSVQSE